MTVIGFSTLFLASFSIAQLYKYNSTNQMLPWMAMMNGGMGGFGMWNNPLTYVKYPHLL